MTKLLQKLETLEGLKQVVARRGLFAILDSCDSPAVRQKVDALGELAVSLYRGHADEGYEDVAPYLVRVDNPLLDWIHNSLCNEPWGIFAIAEAAIGDLSNHFRKFLVVEKPDGEKAYFRFYDPRILRALLPACTSDELNQFYGPIETYGITHFEAGKVMLWRRV
jgi:hypothetical protein